MYYVLNFLQVQPHKFMDKGCIMPKPELTINTVAQYHSFLNALVTTYCDTGNESNQILAKNRCFANLYI
jgi:hypothetical protein